MAVCVLCLFLAEPWVGVWSVIVAIPIHIFFFCKNISETPTENHSNHLKASIVQSKPKRSCSLEIHARIQRAEAQVVRKPKWSCSLDILARIQRGGGTGGPEPSGKSQSYMVPKQYCPDPLENHKATKPLNVV